MYLSDNGKECYDITAGVPQGLVLGPLLWNVMYDEVLRLPGVKIIGFADDIAIVTVAKHIHDVESSTNEAIVRVKNWLKSAKLELAEHKTEALLITGRKTAEYMTVNVGNQVIRSKDSLKYLGVILDNRLNFKEHVKHVCEKASGIQSSLARLLPNIGGPKPERRKLLATVVTSVMLYACPVWADALSVLENRRRLAAVYRLCALRTISGFRTVSDEAAGVVAGMIPIDILADELKRVFDDYPPGQSRKEAKRVERVVSISKWQARWNSTAKGRWTYLLITDLHVWLERMHGTTSYYMTQFLTDHDCFRKYLHRFGHDNSPMCPN